MEFRTRHARAARDPITTPTSRGARRTKDPKKLVARAERAITAPTSRDTRCARVFPAFTLNHDGRWCSARGKERSNDIEAPGASG